MCVIPRRGHTHLTHVESRGSKVRSACVWLEDAHVGENVGTPIGQFLLIGNFRRRLARELLVVVVVVVAVVVVVVVVVVVLVVVVVVVVVYVVYVVYLVYVVYVVCSL